MLVQMDGYAARELQNTCLSQSQRFIVNAEKSGTSKSRKVPTPTFKWQLKQRKAKAAGIIDG